MYEVWELSRLCKISRMPVLLNSIHDTMMVIAPLQRKTWNLPAKYEISLLGGPGAPMHTRHVMNECVKLREASS